MNRQLPPELAEALGVLLDRLARLLVLLHDAPPPMPDLAPLLTAPQPDASGDSTDTETA